MSSRMKLLAVSTAIVAVGGFAWLSSAVAFDGGLDGAPQIAQAGPPATTSPAIPGGVDRPMPPPRPAFNPRNMCLDQMARKVGQRAYLKARLDLKPEQMTAWNAFEKAADEVSAKDKTRCAALPTEIKDPPKFMDRMTRRETMIKARTESFEAVKPSLTALYAALTPDQQVLFDRPMMGGEHHGGGHWHGRG